MSDIRTVFVSMEKASDYAMSGMLLEADNGLDTAVILSLLTDRRANDDDAIPGGVDDKRGGWMDTFLDVEGDQFGSRLWLLERAKLLPETVNRVRDYCYEALAWMIKAGIAKAVNVTASIMRHHPVGIIAAIIEIVKPDGTTTRYQFNDLWSAV